MFPEHQISISEWFLKNREKILHRFSLINVIINIYYIKISNINYIKTAILNCNLTNHAFFLTVV